MIGISIEDDIDDIVTHYADHTLIVDDPRDDDDSAATDERSECYPNKKGGKTQRLLLHQKTCDRKNQESNVAESYFPCMLYVIMCRPVANVVNKSIHGISRWISDSHKHAYHRYARKVVYNDEIGRVHRYMFGSAYNFLRFHSAGRSIPEDERNRLIKEACELYFEIYVSNYYSLYWNLDYSDEMIMEYFHARRYWLKRSNQFLAKVDAASGFKMVFHYSSANGSCWLLQKIYKDSPGPGPYGLEKVKFIYSLLEIKDRASGSQANKLAS